MKIKIKVARLIIDPWDYKFHLVWPVTPDQLADYVRKTVGNARIDSPGEFIGITSAWEDDVIVGLRHPWKGDDYHVGVLVHETFHAVYYMLKNRGIALSGKTQEVFAYAQEDLFKKCLAVLSKGKRK